MGGAKNKGGDKMLSSWLRILLRRMLKELGGQDLLKEELPSSKFGKETAWN